jgi:large subunit ribosomal protein L4
LIVLDDETDEVAYRSFRNLPQVQLILAGELNAYDVLCNDWVVFTQRTLPGEGRVAVDGPGTDEPVTEDAVPDEPAAVDTPAASTEEES